MGEVEILQRSKSGASKSSDAPQLADVAGIGISQHKQELVARRGQHGELHNSYGETVPDMGRYRCCSSCDLQLDFDRTVKILDRDHDAGCAKPWYVYVIGRGPGRQDFVSSAI
jgi:hypothetical protein